MGCYQFPFLSFAIFSLDLWKIYHKIYYKNCDGGYHENNRHPE